MKLPSRMIDLSSPLENETVYDPPFMRPKIEYQSNADTAPMLLELFPGLRREDLPDGEGWAFETVAAHHATTAPIWTRRSISSRHSIDGKPMMTIDEVPLDWFFRPGVKLDFRNVPDGHVVTAAEVEAELKRIGHELKPLDIVLVNTARRRMHRHRRISHRRLRHGPRGDALPHLSAACASPASTPGAGTRRLRICAKRWLETRDPSIIWEGHKAGREIPYCHMEKLANLEQLPPRLHRRLLPATRLKPAPPAGRGRWRCLTKA